MADAGGTHRRGCVKRAKTFHGRAVCFVSGPPSGLTKTLPAALAELCRRSGNSLPGRSRISLVARGCCSTWFGVLWPVVVG